MEKFRIKWVGGYNLINFGVTLGCIVKFEGDFASEGNFEYLYLILSEFVRNFK